MSRMLSPATIYKRPELFESFWKSSGILVTSRFVGHSFIVGHYM